MTGLFCSTSGAALKRRAGLDFDYYRYHHRAALEALVDEAGDGVVGSCCTGRGPTFLPQRGGESSIRSWRSSRNSRVLVEAGTPQAITSGSETTSPSSSAIVATTITMPSAEIVRRSRRAASLGRKFGAVDVDHAAGGFLGQLCAVRAEQQGGRCGCGKMFSPGTPTDSASSSGGGSAGSHREPASRTSAGSGSASS